MKRNMMNIMMSMTRRIEVMLLRRANIHVIIKLSLKVLLMSLYCVCDINE